MKIITLNTYGGQVFEPLIEFIKVSAHDTDFFCFQEVLTTSRGAFVSHGSRANLFSELVAVLPDFQGFFALAQEHFDETALVAEDVHAGLATFMKKVLALEKTGEFFIHGKRNSFVPNDFRTLPYNLHHVQLRIRNRLLTICNVHGVSEPGNKLDTPDRLTQSRRILDFAEQQPGEKIITGDFNLLPYTQSVGIFERHGFRNLVKEFAIPSTRGSLMKKLHPEHGNSLYGWQEFSDYTLISSGILPSRFIVPDLPLSDHLPLILEFTI